jgi:hypothetical protein
MIFPRGIEMAIVWSAISAIAGSAATLFSYRVYRDNRRAHSAAAARVAIDLLPDVRQCQRRAHGDIIAKMELPEWRQARGELGDASARAGGKAARRGAVAVRALQEWDAAVSRGPGEAAKQLIEEAAGALEQLISIEPRR